jgi:hypothetical protein
MSLELIKKFKENNEQINILKKENEEHLTTLRKNMDEIVKKYNLIQLHPHYYDNHDNLKVERKKYVDPDDYCECDCKKCDETIYINKIYISCKECRTYEERDFDIKDEYVKNFYDSFLTYETLYLIHEILELPKPYEWNLMCKFKQIDNKEWKNRIKEVLDTI